MNKRTLSLLIVVLSIVLVCAMPVFAMQEAELTKTLVSFVDDLDREITVELPLQSVVSLAPSITETVCALDLCDKLVGVDYSSNYPAEVTELDIVTNFDMTINYEMILALNPDLVLISELTSTDVVKQLEDLGLNIYYFKNPKTLEDLSTYLMKFGEVTGKEAEAEQLTAELESRIAVVDEIISKKQSTPLVFYELDSTEPAKPWTSSSGTFVDELITRAGGKNVAADLAGEWVQISIEDLIIKDPDIIILADMNYGVTPESVALRSGWNNLSAVKEDQIFGFDSDLASRPGPRLADGLEEIARIIHPELFDIE